MACHCVKKNSSSLVRVKAQACENSMEFSANAQAGRRIRQPMRQHTHAHALICMHTCTQEGVAILESLPHFPQQSWDKRDSSDDTVEGVEDFRLGAHTVGSVSVRVLISGCQVD